MPAALQIWSATFWRAFDKLPSSIRALVQEKVDEMGARLETFPHQRLQGPRRVAKNVVASQEPRALVNSGERSTPGGEFGWSPGSHACGQFDQGHPLFHLFTPIWSVILVAAVKIAMAIRSVITAKELRVWRTLSLAEIETAEKRREKQP